MPRIIPSTAPYPKAMLWWDGTDWRGVLRTTGVQGSLNVVSGIWTDIATYTVPAGRMLTVLSWGGGLRDTGVEFHVNLMIGGATIMPEPSDGTPVVIPGGVWAPATATQVVKVRGLHTAGANREMSAWVRFIEEDAE